MKTAKISALMMERYRLGELDGEDKKLVEETLARDENFRSSLENLAVSDRELRMKFPINTIIDNKSPRLRRFRFSHPFRLAGIAAALLVCILLPVLYYSRSASLVNDSGMVLVSDTMQDRAKGAVRPDFELSLFLKGAEDAPLAENSLLYEGDTVQLAYRIPEGVQYGVIFSIDGRSEVTLHYPYSRGQSSQLVSGRRTLLEEAYTLDDSPGYEIFVLVASPEPLETEEIIKKAEEIRKAQNIDIHFIEDTFGDGIAVIKVLK